MKKLSAPVSGIQVEILDLWAQSEGMPDSTNNWLACGTPWPGSTQWNSTGVQVYPTFDAGSSAIAWSLDNSPYTAIGNGFRAAPGLVAMWKLINASPWCSGCQTGHYPVDLWQAAGHPTQGTHVGTPNPPQPVTGTTGTIGGANGIPVDAWALIQDDVGRHAATLQRRIIALQTRIRKA
ncbi:MAG: hypothetical protein ACYCZM_11935 [Acidimicrobiales bacterium]